MAQKRTKKKPAAQAALARKAAKLKAESKAKLDRPASGTPPRPERDAPVATSISASPQLPRGPPARKFHLDKRIDSIVSAPGNDDDLLTTVQCANWLQVSVQWLEGLRSTRDDGPPFQKLGPNMVRYHRGTVREWALARTHHSTCEYAR
jgi:predicted DNA-binding transcriptional regulator AlpA